MEYRNAKARQAQLEQAVKAAELALSAIPGVGCGPFGLTPDKVKVTPEYQAAKAAFDSAFARLRDFNASFVRTFARELRDERRARREALASAHGESA